MNVSSAASPLLRSAKRLAMPIALAIGVLSAAVTAEASDAKMKGSMWKLGVALTRDDVQGLAPLLTEAKGFVGKGKDVAGMSSGFDRAIKAAKAGDVAAVKAACKDCHATYRDTYRMNYGSKAR